MGRSTYTGNVSVAGDGCLDGHRGCCASAAAAFQPLQSVVQSVVWAARTHASPALFVLVSSARRSKWIATEALRSRHHSDDARCLLQTRQGMTQNLNGDPRRRTFVRFFPPSWVG